MRLAIDPLEDHPPLIIDPDRIKLLEVALELLQPIRRRYRQIHKPACRVDSFKLAFSSTGDTGELPHALESSLQLFAAGLGLAIVIGFFLGLLLARVEVLRTGLEPYVAMLYATPMVALIPFILSVFGFAFRAKLVVVTMFAVWPILINTLEGARSVNVELLEVARSYRSSEPKLWWHVIVPYTLPYTMTGIRQGIARALVGMLAAEFLLAASGLGNLILTYTQRFDTRGSEPRPLRVAASELDEAIKRLPLDVVAGLQVAIANVAHVAQAGTGEDVSVQLPQGQRVRLREVPVAMRERAGGRSSITALRSAYYMVKVLLALFVGLFRRSIVPREES